MSRLMMLSLLRRCPDPGAATKMTKAIEKARKDGDSLGGIVQCRISNVPAGLGDPVFSKLEAELAKGMMSLPASKVRYWKRVCEYQDDW